MNGRCAPAVALRGSLALAPQGDGTADSTTYAVNISAPLHPDLHRRAIADRLINNAVTLRQLEKLIELVPPRVGIEVEAEPDLRKAHWCVLGDAERAAEVEVAFGGYHSRSQRNVECGRNRFERYTSTGDQSLQQ